MREELESMLANSDTDNSGHGSSRESFSSRRRDRGNNNNSNSLMQYVKYHDSYSDLLSEVGNSFQSVTGRGGRNNGNSRTQNFLCVLFPLLIFAIIVLYVYFAWSGSPDASTVTATNTLTVPVEATTMISSSATTANIAHDAVTTSSVFTDNTRHHETAIAAISGVISAMWKQMVHSIAPHLRIR